MKLLEMVKDMKIKYSVSSPPKVWEDFFLLKKLFMGEQAFLGEFMGRLFYIGSNDSNDASREEKFHKYIFQ